MPALLSPPPVFNAFANAGIFGAGYKLYTYAAGTSTPQATFTNRAGSVANANPIILDARGEATIYLSPGVVYDYVLKTDQDATVWTREDVIADAGDANAVRFTQAGTGMVPRDAESKMRDIVHADDRGLLGDGSTDETAALQNLLDAAVGKVLMLGYNKTYAISTLTGLSIPANTTLISNGAKFKRLTARSGPISDSEYNIVVNSNCELDKLEVDCVGGTGDIGGVLVSGSNVRIGLLKVNTPSAGSGDSGSQWNAVRIGPNSGSSSDVDIGRIICANWDRPVTVQNTNRCTIGHVSVETYVRGLYIRDSTYVTVLGGHIRTASPNCVGAAGENGLILESTASNGSLHDIRINNVTVEDSGEHGFRVGGQFIARNIWHVNCHAKNTGTGSGTWPPNDSGACGFKCLGNTSVFGARHQNIHYTDCSVTDINGAGSVSGGRASNFAGFHIGKVFGCSITNPVVNVTPADASYVLSGNSCQNGIEIIGSEKVTITNPNITRPSKAGIYIYDFSDGVNDWGVTTDIKISGGLVDNPVTAGVEVLCGNTTMRRISVSGLSVQAGESVIKCAVSGSGVLTACSASDTTGWSQTVASYAGCSAWMIRAIGNEVGANACVNGSQFNSFDAGTLKIRKAGAWTSL